MIRRRFLVGVGVSFAHAACTSRRGARGSNDASSGRDIFDQFQHGLEHAHRELLAASLKVVETAESPAPEPATLVQMVNRFCDALLPHHKAEEAFFFPAFRAARRLRSSDVAFLARLDDEHRDIHRLALELRESVNAGPAAGWRSSISSTLAELRTLAAPHFDVEERTLTAEHVATMLTARELAAVYQDMKRNWNER